MYMMRVRAISSERCEYNSVLELKVADSDWFKEFGGCSGGGHYALRLGAGSGGWIVQ